MKKIPFIIFFVVMVSCSVWVADVPVLISETPAAPPKGCDPCKLSDLVDLTVLDPTIRLDIRYARTDNFTGKAVYIEARAFLQRPAAEALLSVHKRLREQGYGLIIYDAYRPWSVTKLFWDITPPAKRAFLADPSIGSPHNRGCAVDVGMFELRTGRAVDMPSEYDEMTERSFVTYTGGTVDQRSKRDILRRAMEQDFIFFVYPEEWWHYDFKDLRDYSVENVPFSTIPLTKPAPSKP